MILTKMKRLLQSVKEASPLQVAADLGVDRGMAAATLEHLCAMGKVVRRRPGSGLPGAGKAAEAPEAASAAAPGAVGSTPDDCRERIGCASCPLVRVCDPKSDLSTPAVAGATTPEEEALYAWAAN